MVLQILLKVSQSSACFTIKADECPDITNKEQFTLNIRWVSEDLQDHEEFIGLYAVPSISADCLVCTIKNALLQMRVKLSECCGQCCDGASNMSGSTNGMASQIISEEK